MIVIGGATGVSREALKLQDYILPFGEPEKPKDVQSWQEKKSIAMLIAAAYDKEPTRES